MSSFTLLPRRIGGAVPWCAIWAQDRGQRATEMQALQMRQLISEIEDAAPVADATQLNGNWRLLAALGESTYRSSPFFWANEACQLACGR